MKKSKPLLAAKVSEAEARRAHAVAKRLKTNVSAMIRKMFAELAQPCDEQEPKQ